MNLIDSTVSPHPAYLVKPRGAVWSALVLIGWVIGSAAVVFGAAPGSGDWPQWRGPLGTGAAPDSDPPTTWSESSNVKWKTKIPGDGTSTPVIVGNKIFVLTAVPTGKKVEPKPGDATDSGGPPPPPGGGRPPRDGQFQPGQGQGPGPGQGRGDFPPPPGGPPGGGKGKGKRGGGGMGGPKPTEFQQFVVLCLDRQTGKILWQQVAREEVPHEGYKPGDGSFASPSPVTDGQYVYAHFGSHGIYCYDLDGKLKWSADLGKMRVMNTFGEGSSPALHGNTLVVNWDNEAGSFIVALDKNTGKTLWKQTRDEGTSWSTPVIVEYAGKAQVVTTATRKIRSYDLATGALVWECGGLTRNVIPTPMADKGIIYCMSGFQGNAAMAIKLGRTGDLTGTDAVAWQYGKNTPYVPSALLYGDKLYFFSGNNGMLTSLDAASGSVVIDKERLEAIRMVYASPVGAGGRIYLVGRDGTCVVLKQSDKLEVLATNHLDDKIDASPAVVGKELYLRGRTSLYCLAEK